MENNQNNPINHSIWVVFKLDENKKCYWFEDEKEANKFGSELKNKEKFYSKPVKYVRDY